MEHFLKNNYYNGKLLSADCFNIEQAYNAAKLAQMSRTIFGKGVICGFNITVPYPDMIEISSGAAVDDEGRLITIYDKVTLSIKAIEGFKASEKNHTLRAVYKEAQENDDTVVERCEFIYDEVEGVELAQITFKNGNIEQIHDTRTPVDSLFLKSMIKQSTSAFESQIDNKVNTIFNNYLPTFVKNVEDNLERRLNEIATGYEKRMEESTKKIYDGSKEYTDLIYDTLKKKFEAILDKVNNLEGKIANVDPKTLDKKFHVILDKIRILEGQIDKVKTLQEKLKIL